MATQRQRALHAAFSPFLRPEIVDKLASDAPELDSSFATRRLHCLLIQVRVDSPEDVRRNVERVVSIC